MMFPKSGNEGFLLSGYITEYGVEVTRSLIGSPVGSLNPTRNTWHVGFGFK